MPIGITVPRVPWARSGFLTRPSIHPRSKQPRSRCRVAALPRRAPRGGRAPAVAERAAAAVPELGRAAIVEERRAVLQHDLRTLKLKPPTSAPGLGSRLPPAPGLRSHAATSAPGLGPPPAPICTNEGWAHPSHICAARDWAHRCPHLDRDCVRAMGSSRCSPNRSRGHARAAARPARTFHPPRRCPDYSTPSWVPDRLGPSARPGATLTLYIHSTPS